MIVLTDEPLLCWKSKKEWKFKCKSWIKTLINCCFSQNTTHKLTAYLMYIWYFFSYIHKYLKRCWAKLTGYFYDHINRKRYFYSHENITSYTLLDSLRFFWFFTISRIVHSPLSKEMKGPMRIKGGKCYSLMLLCLKINCINIRTK